MYAIVLHAPIMPSDGQRAPPMPATGLSERPARKRPNIHHAPSFFLNAYEKTNQKISGKHCRSPSNLLPRSRFTRPGA